MDDDEVRLLLPLPRHTVGAERPLQSATARRVVSSLAAMSAPVDPQATGKLSPPKPGASLFDNYANLADPVAFSTDEQEVEELLRLVGREGVHFRVGSRNSLSMVSTGSCLERKSSWVNSNGKPANDSKKATREDKNHERSQNYCCRYCWYFCYSCYSFRLLPSAFCYYCYSYRCHYYYCYYYYYYRTY